MRNLIFGLIYLSYSFKITDAVIVPEDKTYEVMLGEENFLIEWVYDHEESLFTVSWLFRNSTEHSATIVMSKLGGAQAMPVAGYNISHTQNGTIQLQKITAEYLGVYYCTVSYTGAVFPQVTGTATIKLQEDAAIVPRDKTYEVMLGEENFPIEWVYNHEESLFTVSWLFRNLTEHSSTIVMTQPAGTQAVPVPGFDITHVQNGTIELQKITEEYLGVYYCIVSYKGVLGYPVLTGTATIELKKATSATQDDFPWWLTLIIVVSLILGLILNGIILGCYLIKTTECCQCFYNDESCIKLKGLPYWYFLLWSSCIGIPVALGILLVWKCSNKGNADKAGNSKNTRNTRNERKLGRPQPPSPPSPSRAQLNSNRSQLTDMHYKKGRDLTANFTDDHHPLASIDIPAKKAGALEAIPDSARKEVRNKRKKSKKSANAEDDDQSD